MNTNPHAKRILCFGDSNTWGWVPSSMGKKRFFIDRRWTGLLQQKLGNGYEVIEEGLGGRTTTIDDPRPGFPERNGYCTLQGLLETHLPLDLVIIMLGTTELKDLLNRSVEEITDGLGQIIDLIQSYKTLEDTLSPKILIVVPPIMNDKCEFAGSLAKDGTVKARGLISSYEKLASGKGCDYFNPTEMVKVDSVEGVHIDEENHQKLSELIYKKILVCQ